jgi:superfamily I DNA/RNA helicase
VDGNSESRRGTVSVFEGPEPSVQIFDDASAEQKAVGVWIAQRLREDVGWMKSADAQAVQLIDEIKMIDGHVAVSTVHLANGLEFRAVVVMSCDDEVLPLQEGIETVADDADLEEVYNAERHLLYVARTRARDNLLVTGVVPASEFLADFRNAPKPHNLLGS